MTTNPETRMQLRFGTHGLVQNKANKNKILKYAKVDDQKEDYPQNMADLPTYHKIDEVKESRCRVPCTTIRGQVRVEDSFARQRANIFNLYSKMHYCFNLSFESLFLAIDIFDKYFQKCTEKLNPFQTMNIALACFMLAIKYEEVYPPTLFEIQSKMKVKLDFADYVKVQFKILDALEYNLNMVSPVEYFPYFPCEMTPERKSYVYLYLELACLNSSIKGVYNWSEIAKALKLLFMPLTATLNENLPEKVQDCLKKIVFQRSRLDQCYIWLNKKYSDPKFHCMAIKPCYIGEDL